MEPTKHQYDFDCAAVHAFLQKFGLEKEIKLNIEVNHATLAGHSFQHEIEYALANDLFGSIDINRGDPSSAGIRISSQTTSARRRWRSTPFSQGGGLTTGGFNFDAKLRRQSIDPEDLLHAHIGGIDTLARACRMLADGRLRAALEERYRGWGEGLGAAILAGELDLAALAGQVEAKQLDPRPVSGRQEWLENLVSRYL